MRMLILLIFLALAFALSTPAEGILIGQALTEQGFSTGNSLVDDVIDNWQAVSVAGITISFFIAIIMYMGSKALNSEYLSFYARMELESVMNAVAVLIILSGVVLLLDNIFSQTPGVNTVVLEVLNALDFNEKKLVSTYASTLREISEIQLRSSRTLDFGIDEVLIGSPSYSTSLNAESKADLVVKQKILGHLSNLYPYLVGMKTAFKSFVIPVSVVFIAFGMFLYSLYFTRRFGATMLAVGIAGYVVLPLLLHFLLTLAGFIQPSSPYLPGPDCPLVCSAPIPTVVDASGNAVNVDAELEEIIKEKPDLRPFDNVDFVSLLNLSEGRRSLATFSSGTYKGQTLYSCENTTEWISDSSAFCPSVCRNIPYDDSLPTCREYAYNCRRFFEDSDKARGCFKNLSLSGQDYIDPQKNTQKEVPVLTLSGGVLQTTQQDPVIAAVENTCGVLGPVFIPPNIPLKDKEGTKLIPEDRPNFEMFCPNLFRHMTLDFTNLPQVGIDVPFEDADIDSQIRDGCRQFFDEAVSYSDIGLFVKDVASLFNPEKQVCLALEVSGDASEGSEIVRIKEPSFLTRVDTLRSLHGGGIEPVFASSLIEEELEDREVIQGYAVAYYNAKKTTLTDEFVCVPKKCSCTTKGFLGFRSTTDEIDCSEYCSGTKKVITCEATTYTYDLKTKIVVNPTESKTISKAEAESLLGGGLPFDETFSRLLEADNLQGDYVITGTCTSFDPPDAPESERAKAIVDKSQEVASDYKVAIPVFIRGGCENIAAVPSQALTLPPKVDCSKCAKFGRTPLAANIKSSTQGINFLAQAYIRIMMIPTIALALTAVILVALSTYLGGEMFIPAINKVL